MRRVFRPGKNWPTWVYSALRIKNMVIKYFAYYRNFAGRKEESLLLGSLSAIDLLKKLSGLHGSALRKALLTEDGEDVHPDVIFLIDGRNIDFLAGKESVVKEDSVVSLFPRIAGG